ncbi:MAG TPA: PQQ-binding-like beta-propeller repeat protein [Verrucomicrobiae bacterium]|nr:PQQ-binding-like beta-propeller repeat protein [Verrucomicrobiae bacterium]
MIHHACFRRLSLSWMIGWVVVLPFYSPALAGGVDEDWPRFLGPRGNNISSETGLLNRWPEGGPPLLWQKAIGSGYSAPSVRGRVLVLHHRVGGEEMVEGLEADTSKRIWRYAYPSEFVDIYGYNNGPRCSPLLTSNRCYTFGAEGTLACLDLKSGQVIWQRDTTKDWHIPPAFFGVGSTPCLEGDRLIVMVGGQPNSGVVGLDPATGKTIWENVGRTNWQGVITTGWRFERPYEWSGEEKQASYSSPVAATIHGRRHVFCLMRQGLVSLNPTNGAVYFSRWFQSVLSDSVNAMSPVVQNDLVLISAAYARVGSVLLRVKPDGKSFEEVWRSPRQLMDRDPTTGTWAAPVLETHWNTPVLHEGTLYAFSGRNEPDASFRSVDFLSGQLNWSRDEHWAGHPPRGSRAQPAVYGRGSGILADGKLIVLGEGGKLGLFELNPREAVEICSFQVPDLYFPCWAGPVLADKRLYLRSEDHLVCYNLAR